MTRTYAARRLLEHGPLTESELREITGWNRRAVTWALERLLTAGVVVAESVAARRNVYRLA